ncbi:MAG: DNA cytosine methyltransferase [Phycisphaerae bacterium]
MKKISRARTTRRNSDGNGAQKTKHKKLRFIDLFAGIGGFRVALEAIGAMCVWSCEKDALAARWYLENHGDDPTGDITSVNAVAVPEHDILCAGYPCQPYSTQGKALGLADPRGRLFYAIVRILTAKQPSAFILENVDSLGHANNRWSHDRIVAALNTAGYVVYEAVLNAREYGLAQSRRRLFMVGFHRSLGTVPFAWPKRGPLATNRDDFLDERVDAAYIIGAEEKNYLLGRRDDQRAKGNKWSYRFAPLTHVHALLSAAHTSQDNIILDPDDGSWRRLTPNEYRKFQGFPEGFKLPANDKHAYRLLGNSVAVPVVQAIAANVITALRGQKPQR